SWRARSSRPARADCLPACALGLLRRRPAARACSSFGKVASLHDDDQLPHNLYQQRGTEH
ncbi:MAG: hypothetical protein M1118_16235, partial [Chloroflexi bacterium]|nr:hypothetical protein [Chloroflexota bacterium]